MRFFRLIFSFFIIFYVGQFTVSLLLNNLLLSSEFRYSKVYNKNKFLEYDILCIGNSRGVNSFYSPILNQRGYKALNLSYNGINAGEIQIIIDDYLDNHKKPSKIFIEISSVFNNNNNENYNNFLLYSSFSERFESSIKVTDLNTFYISKFFPIFKFNNEVFYRAIYYLNKSDQEWVNQYKISENLVAQTKNMNHISLNLNTKDLLKYKQLNENLKEKNIEVYFFIAPYLPEYKNKIQNFQTLKKDIVLNINSKVYDISNLLKKNQYFADRVHTNKEGAILITNKLLDLVTHN